MKSPVPTASSYSNAGFGASGYRIHRIDGGTGWSYPMHTHDGFWEFVCCTKGEVHQVINGTDVQQKAGEVILIREKDSHSLEGKGFEYFNVMFPFEWLVRVETFLQCPGIADSLLKNEVPGFMQIDTNQVKEFENMLDQLMNMVSRDEGRGVFGHFVTWMSSRYFMPKAPSNPVVDGMPDWLRETVIKIDQSREQFPSIPELVKLSCRCHEHFTRQFTRFMRVTPTDYLTSKRIERAAELLVTTNSKVSHVCRATSFENESYFFRTFRRVKGMSPLEYRQKYGTTSLR